MKNSQKFVGFDVSKEFISDGIAEEGLQYQDFMETYKIPLKVFENISKN